MDKSVSTITSIGVLIVVVAVAGWLMMPVAEQAVTPEPVVIEQETGSPGSFLFRSTTAKIERTADKAHELLADIQSGGLTVTIGKPRATAGQPAVACPVPAQQTAASCQQPVYRRPLLRRRR